MRQKTVIGQVAMLGILAVMMAAGRAPERAWAQGAATAASGEEQGKDSGEKSPRLVGKIVETMNAGGYTYVQIESASGKVWAAGPQSQVAVGDSVDLPAGMAMTNFQSKALDRTFDVIYFVPSLGAEQKALGPLALPMGHPGAGGAEQGSLPPGHGLTGTARAEQVAPAISLDGIVKPEGGKNVEEIYAQKKSLAGQTVLVRGKVLKFTAKIMGKNWLHLRDGTGSEGSNDLTVTTQDLAKIGDTVLVKGDLSLDIDLGSGYKYEVLIENAKVTVE